LGSSHRAGLALRVFLFAAFALGVVSASAGADPQFLGLAVAHSVSHDADGKVFLDGIHHASQVNSFPHEENIYVYTRWSGSGVHEIDVSIWNLDSEETVSEAMEAIEFSPDSITTFVQAFPHATFPESGTYSVEVALDGDLAAEYSLFVNVDDSYPEAPELVLSVPAQWGSLDGAGNASVAGIPDIFSFNRFPAHDNFELVTLWFSGEGSHEQRVEILDPTGVPIATSPAQEIRADYGKMQLLTDSFRDVPIQVRGTYTVVLYLDGEDIFEYPLPVRRE
jgi:hypothetical protein